MKMLVAGLGALIIDSDNFEKNNTSIYVTNGVGSRFFGNFNTNAGSYAVKLETRINGNLAQSGEFATSTRKFPVALNRTENSRDTLRDEIV
jgi:hypothetical protein